MIVTVSITTVVWLAVTFLTRRNPRTCWSHSIAARIRRCRLASDRASGSRVQPATGGLSNLLDWICGCVLIYGILFGTGKILLHEMGTGSRCWPWAWLPARSSIGTFRGVAGVSSLSEEIF